MKKILFAAIALLTSATVFGQKTVNVNNTTNRLQPTNPWVTFPTTSLRLDDTDASNQLTITNGTNLVSNRTLTILTTGDSTVTFPTSGTLAVVGGGGLGDVVGPASATDNAIARYDLATGKLLQNSAVTIADTTGSISINGTDAATGVNTGGFKSENFGLSTVSGGASWLGGNLFVTNGNPFYWLIEADQPADATTWGVQSEAGVFKIRAFNDARSSAVDAINFARTGNVTIPTGTLAVSNTTTAIASTVGALTIGNGVAATNVAIGGGNINAGGTITVGGTVIHTLSATPASASAAGTVGTMSWDANYIYICTATNTWKRVAIATW